MSTMPSQIEYRPAVVSDALRLSVLFQQVYIKTYGTEGVTTEFARFIVRQFAVEKIEKTMLEDPGSLIVGGI
jgi:hypothetical protein